MLLSCVLATTPVSAQESEPGQAFRIVQNDGMTLSEAVESVRRSTNGRIVSAETRTSGGREVHYVKVLTKDGKVKTHKIPGRKIGNGKS
jgi:uncharacterized membrane protein YkoI